MNSTRIISLVNCQECGGGFTPKREHGRFCSDYCRVKWNRRNARAPVEPPAAARAAARDLVLLAGARQRGVITAGQFAAASVALIRSRFTSVHDALIALAAVAWEAMETAGHPAHDHESERVSDV